MSATQERIGFGPYHVIQIGDSWAVLDSAYLVIAYRPTEAEAKGVAEEFERIEAHEQR